MKKLALLSLFLSSSAFAHIELDAPLVRYSNSASEVNKHCPCGGGGGDQYCSNGVTTDNARDNSRVTTFTAGQTITVSWRETIGHSGRFRIAFAPDGADQAAFDANILADFPDPSDSTGTRTHDVTLPNTPCTNCTLQLLQIMNGNTTTPVLHLGNSDRTYFQCADLVLVAASGGEGEGEGAVGEGEGAAGEGEGAAGEGEGAAGEGEGAAGEGEGAAGEGEGGEGEGAAHPSCSSTGSANVAFVVALAALGISRRRRR